MSDCTRSHPHENMDQICELRTVIARLENEKARLDRPIDMVLHCPKCHTQHIDKDNSDELRIEAAERGIDRDGDRECERWIEEREWTNPPHRSHLCHQCGHIWRPADVPTNGVQAVKTRGKADSDL